MHPNPGQCSRGVHASPKARWLLMAHDRAEGASGPSRTSSSPSCPVSARAGVTVVAGALQRAGLLRYDQGRMQMLDREGHERASCEYHAVVRREYLRLLGPTPGN